MQIRAITVNAAGTAAERDIQGNTPPGTNRVQAEKNVFGAECRVTISREGKNLSRHQTAQTEKSGRNTQSVKEERKLLRQQEQTELSKEIREGYREDLNEIDKQIAAYNSSYDRFERKKVTYDAALMDKTLEEHQELLTAMQNQKQYQIEESQRLAREAQQLAMQSGYQDEIDENNRELVTLLKTIEEAEKAEDEREDGASETEGGDSTSTSGAENSVGDVIQNSAAQFISSSVKREWSMEERLAELEASGRWFLDTADSITKNVLRESANIRAALDDGAFSDEQIEEMMKLLQDGTTKPGLADEFRKRGWGTGMDLNYEDVKNFRTFGLQVLRYAQEAGIQHIADDPLKGMQKTKESMMLSAADAFLGEARQGSLDRTSRELADEVERLINERNDTDRIRRNEEEDNELLPEAVTDEEEQAGPQEKLLRSEEPI